MKNYKVKFKDNEAVATRQIDDLAERDHKIENKDGKVVLRYITIVADNEQQSISRANQVAKDYLRLTCGPVIHKGQMPFPKDLPLEKKPSIPYFLMMVSTPTLKLP
jgi:hypothetical protein